MGSAGDFGQAEKQSPWRNGRFRVLVGTLAEMVQRPLPALSECRPIVQEPTAHVFTASPSGASGLRGKSKCGNVPSSMVDSLHTVLRKWLQMVPKRILERKGLWVFACRPRFVFSPHFSMPFETEKERCFFRCFAFIPRGLVWRSGSGGVMLCSQPSKAPLGKLFRGF